MRTFRTSGERKTLKDTLPAVLIVLASLLAASGPVWAQTPMSTAFSYQGQIKERGEPVTDAGDFVFELWDAPIGGRLLATDSIPNVPIADGLFTAQIDFGADFFNGNARWLEITVDLHHGGNATLSPRQPINATPYALYALNSSGGGGDCLWTINGNDIYYDAGDVGVGTSNPTYPLHVTSVSGDTAIAGENLSESTFGYLGYEHAGVYGEGSVAVRGVASSETGRGVHGVASAVDGESYGVYGQSASRAGLGVYGYASSTDGGTGVKGEAASRHSYGVWGHNNASSANAIGVFGSTASPVGFGGYFDGRGYFSGNVGVGTMSPGSPLTVAGLIESTADGFKFPDGTIQTTAASGGGGDCLWTLNGSDIHYNAGNVGVGIVTNPLYPLHAVSSEDVAVISVNNTTVGASGTGIAAETSATASSAVFGRNNSATGENWGLYGLAYSPDGEGVRGRNLAASGDAIGVHGLSGSTEGIALYGRATSATGMTYGVYGLVDSPDGYAGYFDGRGYFSGNVGVGTTTPDSPLTVAGLVESTTAGFKFPDGTIQTSAATGGGDSFWQEATTGIRYNDGNVGLGAVTVPSSVLHVVKGSEQTPLIAVNNTTDTPSGTGMAVETSATAASALFGRNNSTTGENWGLYGLAYSPDGEGVRGRNLASSGDAIGVHGMSSSTEGTGVYGHAISATGTTYGVYGETDSSSGYGVYGVAPGNGKGVSGRTNSGIGVYGTQDVSGNFGYIATNDEGVYGEHDATGNFGQLGTEAAGVHGESDVPGDYAVRGLQTATSSDTPAVYGEHAVTDGYGLGVAGKGGYRGVYGIVAPNGSHTYTGVYGYVSSATGTGTNRGVFGLASGGYINYGVYGSASGGTIDYAGYFTGDLHCTGTLSKGGGTFTIDHPLDPENKILQHSFVESPDMMNIYNGNVVLDSNGAAVVSMPEWFEALNMEFRYQLTCIGGFAHVYIAEEIADNQFKIAGGKPGLKVSWQVTGVRQDPFANANRVQVEVDKPEDERGTYLHPEAWGVPAELQVDRVREARELQEREEAAAELAD